MQYKRELREGKTTKKTEQTGETFFDMTTQCEDYSVIKDEECYIVVRDDAVS